MSKQPSDYKAALDLLKKPLFLTTPKYQQQQHRANRDGADPDIVEFERRLVARLKKLDVPVFGHTVVRTYEEQAGLFRAGHSKDSPEDGRWPHMAYAVDIVHGVLGWNLPKPCWDLIGHVGKEVSVQASIPITWGGDWKFYDPAHWELRDWKSRIK